MKVLSLLLVLVLSMAASRTAAEKEHEPPVVVPTDAQEGYVGLVASQISPDPYRGRDKFELVLNGEFALVQIHVPADALVDDGAPRPNARPSYSGVRADFCAIESDTRRSYGENPSLYPQYRDLHDSIHCREHAVGFDLAEVASAARERDGDDSATTRSASVRAFMFHQPKSGSTVISNAIAASDPEKVRMVSGSAVLLDALKACGGQRGIVCDESMKSAQIKLLRDAAYMLGRTTRPAETDLYFKVPPSGTFYLSVVREAFPEAKWIFTYRDPDTVLRKVMTTVFKKSCSSQHRKHAAVREYVQRSGSDQMAWMTDEQLCSAAMATMVSIAFEEHASSGTGLLLDYDAVILGKENGGVEGVMRNYLGINLDNGDVRARVINQLVKKATGGTGEPWRGEMLVEEHIIMDPSSKLVQANEHFLGKEMKKQHHQRL